MTQKPHFPVKGQIIMWEGPVLNLVMTYDVMYVCSMCMICFACLWCSDGMWCSACYGMWCSACYGVLELASVQQKCCLVVGWFLFVCGVCVVCVF